MVKNVISYISLILFKILIVKKISKNKELVQKLIIQFRISSLFLKEKYITIF